MVTKDPKLSQLCPLEGFQILIKIFEHTCVFLLWWPWGWLGVAKVLGILRHWGIQLILASSWARPTILLAGKDRGGMFLFLLFLHFHSCSSFFPVPLFHLFYYLFSPFLWETTQNDT